MDYSECYNNTKQDEIQSAYFGNSTLSTYTACDYILDRKEEFLKCFFAAGSECSEVTTRESWH